MNVKKAIFPVGGLGTRFLPATKSMPKEMLPVVDKPLIQYAVISFYILVLDMDCLLYTSPSPRDS